MTPSNKKVQFSHSVIFYIGESPDWREYRRDNSQRQQADNLRFKERIEHLSTIISPILTSEHRQRIIQRNGYLWSL